MLSRKLVTLQCYIAALTVSFPASGIPLDLTCCFFVIILERKCLAPFCHSHSFFGKIFEFLAVCDQLSWRYYIAYICICRLLVCEQALSSGAKQNSRFSARIVTPKERACSQASRLFALSLEHGLRPYSRPQALYLFLKGT